MDKKSFSLLVLIVAIIAMLVIGIAAIAKIDRTCASFVKEAERIRLAQEDINLHMEAIDEWLTEEPEEVVVVVEQSTPDIDLELIARVVAAEARGESLEGQMAVAQVIKDRSDLWGKTPEEIVLSPAQFADPYGGEVPETTWDAVERVFIGGEKVFSEPVTHFYAYELCSPYWAETKVCRGRIGGHEFLF